MFLNLEKECSSAHFVFMHIVNVILFPGPLWQFLAVTEVKVPAKYFFTFASIYAMGGITWQGHVRRRTRHRPQERKSGIRAMFSTHGEPIKLNWITGVLVYSSFPHLYSPLISFFSSFYVAFSTHFHSTNIICILLSAFVNQEFAN